MFDSHLTQQRRAAGGGGVADYSSCCRGICSLAAIFARPVVRALGESMSDATPPSSLRVTQAPALRENGNLA